MESEVDPAGKGKDSEDDFVHSSPKAKRNKLSLCKRKVLSPSSRFNTTASTEVEALKFPCWDITTNHWGITTRSKVTTGV